MDRCSLRPLTVADAGELLTLQRAAYVSEAQLYDDPRLPPLTQTMQDLCAELSVVMGLAAVDGARIVGAVRARQHGPVLHIERLTVAPDRQGQGIGSVLLAAIEASCGATSAELFTGHLSAANLRLYERMGYREKRREQLRPGITLVYLGKDLSPRRANSR
jgi:ribosomal protein S18 acetylase RimI-like enzyme